MQNAIRSILGKRIQSIVASEHNQHSPSSQIFFIFDDHTVYELYGNISSTSGLSSGGVEGAISYARMFEGKITVYD